MPRRSAHSLAVAALAAAASAGCTNKMCTEQLASCDQTTVTLYTSDNAWAPGTYDLVTSIDGATVSCSLALTADAAAAAAAVTGSCGRGSGSSYTLSLLPFTSCVPLPCSSGACGVSCSPLPGQFEMVLGVPALHAAVGLQLSRDGKSLLDDTLAPNPTTTEPYGKGCGFCTNAATTKAVGS